MKVSDLIAGLLAFDQDAEVVLEGCCGHCYMQPNRIVLEEGLAVISEASR